MKKKRRFRIPDTKIIYNYRILFSGIQANKKHPPSHRTKNTKDHTLIQVVVV